jgi:hypothetical protein
MASMLAMRSGAMYGSSPARVRYGPNRSNATWRYSSALSDNTAVMLSASCTMVSTASHRRPRRNSGAAIALPAAIPASTAASMIVNA